MSLLNTLGIGQSGLRVASYGIQVTGDNVVNAETDGYVRKSVVTETRPGKRINSRTYLGQGTTVNSVRRSIDRYITERHLDSRGSESEARTANQNLQVLETSFREGDISGISDRFDAFFDAMTELTLEPSDSGLRDAVVESGKDLATAVNQASDGVDENVRRIEARMNDELSGINDLLDEISSLNSQISDSDAVTGPGPLMDQRDQVLGELVEKIGGSVEYKANGQVNLYVGGHAVIQDVHKRELTVTGSPGSLDVQMSVDGSVITITEQLGGEMGGLLSARTVSQNTGSDIDTFVEDFSDAFNLQHGSGFDRTGASGGDFFTFGATNPGGSFAVDSTLAEDSTLIAAAGAATAFVGDADNLTAMIDIEDSLLFAGGTETSREFIASIYADLGAAVKSFASEQETEAAALADVTALHTAMTGVDLDDEAVKLIQFQASYNAAARVVTTADELLDTLMRM